MTLKMFRMCWTQELNRTRSSFPIVLFTGSSLYCFWHVRIFSVTCSVVMNTGLPYMIISVGFCALSKLSPQNRCGCASRFSSQFFAFPRNLRPLSLSAHFRRDISAAAASFAIVSSTHRVGLSGSHRNNNIYGNPVFITTSSNSFLKLSSTSVFSESK